MRRAAICVLALGLVLMMAGQADAFIVGAAGINNGNGIVGVNSPFRSNELEVLKEYTAIGPMDVQIQVDAPGTYVVSEEIFNFTGIDWTDFHWELSEEFGDVTFDGIGTIAPFTNAVASSGLTVVDVDGGILPSGSDFAPVLILDVGNPNGGLFRIRQTPTTGDVIPEPATLSLLALGGLALLRRKRKQT